jgi:hypothetical protein
MTVCTKSLFTAPIPNCKHYQKRLTCWNPIPPIQSNAPNVTGMMVSDSHFELWSVLVSRALSGQARRIYKKGATNDHFRILSILVCRAISECIRRKLIVHEKGVAIDRFQLWRILICRTMLYFISHKTIYEKRIADAQFQLLTLSICKAISDYLCCRTICKDEIAVDRFVNLPEVS